MKLLVYITYMDVVTDFDIVAVDESYEVLEKELKV